MQKKFLLSIEENKASNYVKMLKRFDITPTFDPLTDCDGLILCGGGDLSPCLYRNYLSKPDDVDIKRDYYEMFLIKKYLYLNKPIFGICKGLQMINVFFGGSHLEDIDRKDIHYSTNRFDNKHCVFIANKSFLHNALKEISFVNSYHHQAAKITNKRLIATLFANDLTVEAIESRRDKIFATQFHPERMTKKYNFSGYKIFGDFLKYFSVI